MGKLGRPKAELVLTDDERETLQRWVARRKSSQQLALRSRIVLECATGDDNSAVAERLGVSRPTVGKWRSRFVQHRLDGLVDEARPGAPRKITDEQVEKVLTDTLETTPKNAPIGPGRRWPNNPGSVNPPSDGSGKRSNSNPTAPKPSNSPPTRSSSTRYATSSVSTSTRRTKPSCSASTRSRRSKHSTGPSRCCR